MKVDPITISLIALAVAIAGLLLSSYRAAVDRKLQWEQLRGSIHTQLTSRGVEVLTMIEELRHLRTNEVADLTGKLIRVAQGLVDIRKKLKEMEKPPWFLTSTLITRLAPITSDLDDAEPIFETLLAAIREANFARASVIEDGLVGRIYGCKGQNTEPFASANAG